MKTLYFENHPEPVEIAEGYGFKAPKSWGAELPGPVLIEDSDADACCGDFEINPLAGIDQQIKEAEDHLDLVTRISDEEISKLRRGIADLDVQALVASGPQRLEMIEGQRDFKLRRIKAIDSETKTEIANQKERVARLKTLRSRKRKDMER